MTGAGRTDPNGPRRRGTPHPATLEPEPLLVLPLPAWPMLHHVAVPVPAGDGIGRERLIGEAFVALADTLVADYDVIELLDRLVGYSVALLAADAAGLLLTDTDGQLRVVAASSEHAQLMDLMQLHADQGPCLDCVRTSAPVSVPDLAREAHRWPRLTAAVTGRGGFVSVHALPLRLRGQAIGALSLLHRTPGALPPADLALGQALADVATIGILQQRAIYRGEVVAEQLTTALTHRVVIEQAKGMIALTNGRDLDAAFGALRDHARRHQQLLVEVAHGVVTGELILDPAGASPRHTRRRKMSSTGAGARAGTDQTPAHRPRAADHG